MNIFFSVEICLSPDIFLSTDQDPSAKRNAFLALCELDEARALRYVEETDWTNADALERSGRNLLQGPAVQLIYRAGLQHPQDRWFSSISPFSRRQIVVTLFLNYE